MKGYFREIVKETYLITEKITKSTSTKNTKTEIVKRKTVKALELSCGHIVPLTNINKRPKNAMNCFECFENKGVMV